MGQTLTCVYTNNVQTAWEIVVKTGTEIEEVWSFNRAKFAVRLSIFLAPPWVKVALMFMLISFKPFGKKL